MFGDQDEYVTFAHMKIILTGLAKLGFDDETMLVGIRRKDYRPRYGISLSSGAGGPSYDVEIKDGEAVFTKTGYTMS